MDRRLNWSSVIYTAASYLLQSPKFGFESKYQWMFSVIQVEENSCIKKIWISFSCFSVSQNTIIFEIYGWSNPIKQVSVFQLALFCNGLLSGSSPRSPAEASVTASPARRDNQPLVKGPGRLHWGHSASFTFSAHASSSYHRCHARDTTRLCDFVCGCLWGDGRVNRFMHLH